MFHFRLGSAQLTEKREHTVTELSALPKSLHHSGGTPAMRAVWGERSSLYPQHRAGVMPSVPALIYKIIYSYIQYIYLYTNTDTLSSTYTWCRCPGAFSSMRRGGANPSWFQLVPAGSGSPARQPHHGHLRGAPVRTDKMAAGSEGRG